MKIELEADERIEGANGMNVAAAIQCPVHNMYIIVCTKEDINSFDRECVISNLRIFASILQSLIERNRGFPQAHGQPYGNPNIH